MAASYTQSLRSATKTELANLRNLHPRELSLDLVVKVALAAAAAGAYFAGNAGGWTGGIFGFFFPLALAGWFYFSTTRGLHTARRNIARDIKSGKIEVLTISEAEPLLVFGKHESVEPAFAFELDGNRTLLLVGPWLSKAYTYDGPGAHQPRGGGKSFANGMPPPYAFPVDAFEVHRFTESGVVTRIWLHGEYLAPRPLGSAIPLISLGGFMSLVLEVPPSQVPQALQARQSRL